MNLSLDQLKTLCPRLGEGAQYWVVPLNACCEEADINTPSRFAAFLGQAIHESSQFTVLEENLNYTADGLIKTFGKYFTSLEATGYAHQPERIANRVYANRMGNGNEASGDGWLHRGYGIFQHTGKNNHEYLAVKLEDHRIALEPPLLMDPDYACAAAAVYWLDNDCNQYADAWDIDAVSDMVNGGHVTPKKGDSIGFAERLRISNAALALISQAASS